MMLFFIILQFILLLFMLVHHWIAVPPLNDVAALKANDSYFYRFIGSVINGSFVLIPLIITLIYYRQPHIVLPASITIVVFYLVLTIGTIFSWWVPYFFGSSLKHKERFNKFKNTHTFLPARGDNVIPNTLHVIIHLQVWTCLAMAVYFLLKN
jgi:hypothetical protein